MVTIVDTIDIVAGDDVAIPVKITDLNGGVIDYSSYGEWKCQWRLSENSPEAVDATVTINGDKLSINFTSEQTRSMKSSGVIDLQTDTNGVKTWIKATTNYILDVTR